MYFISAMSRFILEEITQKYTSPIRGVTEKVCPYITFVMLPLLDKIISIVDNIL